MLPSAKVTPEVTPTVETGERNQKRLGRKGRTLVQQLATEGKSNTAIAEALRVNRSTFANILKRQPEIAEALARGRSALEGELTDILLGHAREGNVVAAIYLTKARCGWVEGQAMPGVVNNTQVNIVMPPPMPPEEFRRIIDLRPAEAGA